MNLGDMVKQLIRCSETDKLLARIDKQGIYLYCKICGTEHLIIWEEISSMIGEEIPVSTGR